MSTDLAHRWVWKGDRDFSLASQVRQEFPDMAAFHYQQAAEKYLKAFLTYSQVGLKKTHNIGTLALLASNLDPIFSSLVTVADVDAITEFATLFRYPNEEEVDFPDAGDLNAARAFCEAVKALVLPRILLSN
jgi:HEPN domain-containing protein